MLISAAASIEIHKQQLNELNVFPVPDGDTGTNMSMTINAAAADLRKSDEPSLEKASHVTASAMLRGARGNSGVILSLLLRGVSKRLKGAEIADGVLWADALQEGVDAAYKAVMKPAENIGITIGALRICIYAADASRIVLFCSQIRLNGISSSVIWSNIGHLNRYAVVGSYSILNAKSFVLLPFTEQLRLKDSLRLQLKTISAEEISIDAIKIPTTIPFILIVLFLNGSTRSNRE